MCLQEVDIDWNISWPLTTMGQVVIQKCPGGAESLGMYVQAYTVEDLCTYIF